MYYVHEVVDNNGNVYSFESKKEEPTSDRLPSLPGGLDTVAGSSGNNVAQQEQNVKPKSSRELETVEELRQQNELLKKQVDYWHSQTAVTVGERGADKEEVKKLARQLRRDYGSQTEVSDYLPELQWLADNRQNKKARFADMMQTAENVARQVLDGCRVNVNEEQMETMKELKKFLRGRYINVDDSLKEDIGDFGDFKKLNRALHFREDGSGTGVDSLWLELQDQFGEGLFPEDVQNPADQIKSIFRYRHVYPMAIEAVASGKINFKGIVTDVFPCLTSSTPWTRASAIRRTSSRLKIEEKKPPLGII